MARIVDEQKSSKINGWEITWLHKPKLATPIMIEGLPGIGNVGKIVMDLLVEGVKAKKILDLFSHDLPANVYILEDNLVSLPKIEVYYKRLNNQDFLFMTGDTQPNKEHASYALCEFIMEELKTTKAKLLITTGGIGLDHVPDKAKVFCSGTDKKTVNEFAKRTKVNKSIYGTVGPIIGVTGVLLGMARRHHVAGVTLLAETFGHPLYLGLRGAREILRLLDAKYKLKIDFKDIDKELKFMDDQLKGTDEPPKSKKFRQAYKNLKSSEQQATNYIG